MMILLTACLGLLILFVMLIVRQATKRPYFEEEPLDEIDEAAANKSIRVGFTKARVPENLDVIVIGSGLGGLSTATLLARTGRKVLVLEQHDVAGGCSHSFKEQGYEFDTGLHYVGNMHDPSIPSRRLLDSVTGGYVKWAPMNREDNNYTYDMMVHGDTKFAFRAGEDRLKADLEKRFPGTSKQVEKYISEVKWVLPLAISLVSRMLPTWVSKLLWPLINYFHSRAALTTDQMMKRIFGEGKDSEEIRSYLTYVYGDYGLLPEDSSWLIHCAVVNHYLQGASYPVGGSSVLAQGAAQVLKRYGGSILVRAPVAEILLGDNGEAIGVKMQKESHGSVYAPLIVSAAGAHNTYCRLLPPRVRTPELQTFARRLSEPGFSPSCNFITLFVGFRLRAGCKPTKIPSYNLWCFPSGDYRAAKEKFMQDDVHKLLSDPENEEYPPSVCFISFPSSKDPSWETKHPDMVMAEVLSEARYDWFDQWEANPLKHRGAAYDLMKEGFSEKLLNSLYKQVPELETNYDLEVSELGTGLSNNYYLGSAKGEVYGLEASTKRVNQTWLGHRTPVSGLYLSGQDSFLAGLAGAAQAGYSCAVAIDKRVLWDNLGCL